jgi:hypothetical protein
MPSGMSTANIPFVWRCAFRLSTNQGNDPRAASEGDTGKGKTEVGDEALSRTKSIPQEINGAEGGT